MRHGTYERMSPPGTRIARWYCREGQTTISLLPDCLASHLPGTLAEVEAVVDTVEHAPSVERAAESLRPTIELPGAIRWTRRRMRMVRALLTTVIGLMPGRFAGCAPTLASFRAVLGDADVLVALRAVVAAHLAHVATPVGFDHRTRARARRLRTRQHQTGPDPPPDCGEGGS